MADRGGPSGLDPGRARSGGIRRRGQGQQTSNKRRRAHGDLAGSKDQPEHDSEEAPARHLMRGGHRFSEKITLTQESKTE
jgi:hypothetical protein